MSFGANRPMRRISITAARASLCAALVLLWACEKKPAYTPPPPPKVTVSQPVRGSVADTLDLTGNTQAVNTVQLRARVEGYLDKVLFKDGEPVKKDQPLFLIQQNTYVARLQQAEGSVLTQKALLDHARIEYERYSGLYNQKAAAQTDVENWRYQRDSAQAALMTAEAQRDLARLDLGYTQVAAPFTGRIDRRLVDPGNLVGSGTSTVLAEITQTDPLYVYFTVSETDISPILRGVNRKPGQKETARYTVHVGLSGEEGYPHEGYLDFAATTVSTSTGTLLVRAVLANTDGKMLPGQFARVKVPVGEERDVLLVPQVAVSFDQLGSFVLLVDESNTVERRNVKTGARKGDLYAIEEGLKGDERVIFKGLLRAIPGRKVTPEQGKPSQQPPDGPPTPDSHRG